MYLMDKNMVSSTKDQYILSSNILGSAHVLNIYHQYSYLLHNYTDPWKEHYKYKQQVGIVLS